MVNWLKYILNVYSQIRLSKGHLECIKDLKAQTQKSGLPITVVYLGKFLNLSVLVSPSIAVAALVLKSWPTLLRLQEL